MLPGESRLGYFVRTRPASVICNAPPTTTVPLISAAGLSPPIRLVYALARNRPGLPGLSSRLALRRPHLLAIQLLVLRSILRLLRCRLKLAMFLSMLKRALALLLPNWTMRRKLK